MKVVDLHPEDLLAKDARGELTDSESARLDAHLARCSTCKFERQLRADFAAELDDSAGPSAHDLVALALGKVVEVARHEAPREEREEPEARVEPARSRWHPRQRLWLLAAAALFVGGIAGATAQSWTSVATVQVVPSAAPIEPTVPASSLPVPLVAKRAPQHPVTVKAEAPSEESVQIENVTPPPAPAPLAASAAPVRARVAPRPSAVEAIPQPPQAPSAPSESASSLFDAASEARRRGDHARAIELNRQLQQRYPSSREAHVSHATVAQLLLDRGDAVGASAGFEAYRAQGSTGLDETVMVGRATALERLGRVDEARAAWGALLTAFPSSPYARHARGRLGGSH